MAYPYTMTYTSTDIKTGATIAADHLVQSNTDHINNNIPESIDDYSVNATEMGTVTDPYPASSESLATTLDGELKRIRYQIEQLVKKFDATATKWYHDIGNTLVTPTIELPLIGDTTDNTKDLTFALSGATTAKTMTIASSHTDDRTLTLPNATDTLVGKATTDTLTNKTLTTPTLSVPVIADFTSATHNHSSTATGGNLGNVTAGTITMTQAALARNAATGSIIVSGGTPNNGAHVELYGGSHANANDIYIDADSHTFRSQDATNTVVVINPSVDTTTFNGKISANQNGSTAAMPPLVLTQTDIDQDMIEFDGTTIGVGNAIEAVGAKSLTTTHFIKITITGVGTRYIPCGTIA